jgi:peptidyl-prolyl cis-trans isomerase D
MLTFFRRGLTAKLMLILLGLVLAAIVITGFGSGGMGLGELSNLRGGGLATIGGVHVTSEEVTGEANRQLDAIRREQPEADMAGFVREGGVDAVLDRLINANASMAFGEDNGLVASKSMVDREIAGIPAFQNLAGKFDEALFRRALADQKISEAQLRQEIARQLIQRQLIVPAAGSPVLPRTLAEHYGSLLLESRSGVGGIVPAAAMPAGAPPTDAEIAAAYRTGIARYTIPERRVIRYALFGTEQVAAQAKASEAEIAAAYREKASTYAARETRILQQVVLPTEAAARGFAQKLASGTSFEQAAQQAGFAAGDINIGEQSREAFAKIASPAVAAAAFSAAKGAATQPVKSTYGWHVVRVADIRTIAGKPLEAVRGELVTAIEQRKSQEALTDLASRIDEALSGGASFAEVVRANQLSVAETPALTAAGVNPDDPAWKQPAELKPMLEPAFAMSSEDAPTVEAVIPNQRFAIISVARVVAAAAPPLAQIKDRVRNDLVAQRALARARAVATEIVARINGGMPAAQAFAAAKLSLPPLESMSATRRELANQQGRAPAAMAMMFSLRPGKARMLATPNGSGWLIVQLQKVVPGDAGKDPGLVQGMRSQFAQILNQEYAIQFGNSIRAGMKLKRNEKAIAALKAKLTSGGGQ